MGQNVVGEGLGSSGVLSAPTYAQKGQTHSDHKGKPQRPAGEPATALPLPPENPRKQRIGYGHRPGRQPRSTQEGPCFALPLGSWGQTLPGDRLGCHAQLLCPAPQALLARCWPASIGSCPLTPRRATVPGLWGPAQEEQGPLESSSWSLEGSCLGSFVSGGKTQTCHGSPGPTSVPVVDESTHSFTHSFIHSRAIS